MFNQPFQGPGSHRGMGPTGQMPMGNPMGTAQGQTGRPTSPLAAIPVIRDLMSQGPNQVYASMYQSNPQFRAFADSMSGKSPEQAFQEAGYNFGQIQQMVNGMR